MGFVNLKTLQLPTITQKIKQNEWGVPEENPELMGRQTFHQIWKGIELRRK